MALCCDWICCCEICRFCRFNECSWTARSRTCWKSCENLLCPVNDAGVMRLEIELDRLLMLLSALSNYRRGSAFPTLPLASLAKRQKLIAGASTPTVGSGWLVQGRPSKTASGL